MITYVRRYAWNGSNFNTPVSVSMQNTSSSFFWSITHNILRFCCVCVSVRIFAHSGTRRPFVHVLSAAATCQADMSAVCRTRISIMCAQVCVCVDAVYNGAGRVCDEAIGAVAPSKCARARNMCGGWLAPTNDLCTRVEDLRRALGLMCSERRRRLTRHCKRSKQTHTHKHTNTHT